MTTETCKELEAQLIAMETMVSKYGTCGECRLDALPGELPKDYECLKGTCTKPNQGYLSKISLIITGEGNPCEIPSKDQIADLTGEKQKLNELEIKVASKLKELEDSAPDCDYDDLMSRMKSLAQVIEIKLKAVSEVKI